jgi:hypothetical protein
VTGRRKQERVWDEGKGGGDGFKQGLDMRDNRGDEAYETERIKMGDYPYSSSKDTTLS